VDINRKSRRALFFRFDHGAAHVVAAFGADGVRGHCLTALGTVRQLLGMLLIVRTAAAGFLVRLSSLRDGHDNFLQIK
jgi:hypothetical protein